MTERRSSARLAVEIPSTVELEGTPIDATMRDISAVGARVETSVSLGDDARTRLVLRVDDAALPAGLAVDGRVMYSRERAGSVHSGIQFVDLDADKHRAVHAFLATILEGDGGGGRAHPRVHHRQQLVCKSKDQVRAYLNDISAGGLSVVVAEPVSIGDEITSTLVVGSLKPLVLPGTVVRMEAVEGGGGHRVGIELGELPEEAAALLAKLIRALLTPA